MSFTELTISVVLLFIFGFAIWCGFNKIVEMRKQTELLEEIAYRLKRLNHKRKRK